MNYLIFIFVSFLLYGCNKTPDPDISKYPKGFLSKDLSGSTDCSLSECSDKRTIRFIAQDVAGIIEYSSILEKYRLTYTFSFDSKIALYFCDLPGEFKKENTEVVFSGKIVDACGVYQATGPVEEVYIVKLDKINLK